MPIKTIIKADLGLVSRARMCDFRLRNNYCWIVLLRVSDLQKG
jgi:hypothetical protein